MDLKKWSPENTGDKKKNKGIIEKPQIENSLENQESDFERKDNDGLIGYLKEKQKKHDEFLKEKFGVVSERIVAEASVKQKNDLIEYRTGKFDSIESAKNFFKNTDLGEYSCEEIEGLVEDVCILAENNNKKYDKIFSKIFFSNLRRNTGKINEYLVTAFAELSKQYPIPHNAVNYVSPEYIDPGKFIEIYKDIAWRNNDSVKGYQQGLFESFGEYACWLSNELYKNILLEAIDINNSEDIYKTAALINSIKWTYRNFVDLEYSHQNPKPVLEILKEKKTTANGSDNYFLYSMIENVLENLDNWSQDRDKLPVHISRDYVGRNLGREILLARKEDEEYIFGVSKKIEDIDKKMFEAANNNFGFYGMSNEEQWELKYYYSELEKRINIKLTDVLDIDSLDEGDIYNYNILMERLMRERIEREFDIKIEDLSLKEQFFFLDYVKRYSIDEIKSIQCFTKKFGINGARSFLSTSGDLEFGENILKIGENFEPEVANLIFEKYSELVDKVDETENELRNEFGQEADVSEAVRDISEKLLREGKALLKEWSEKEDEVSLEEAQEALNKIDANLKLQLNVYKYLSGCGVDCLKESLNVNLVKIDALKLSQDREKVKEMEEIYRSNYSEYDEFQDLLIEKFREKFAENKEVEFYILENKKDSENEIAGFIAFERKDNETMEMSSVNLSQEYKGYKMGEDMILGPIQELNEKYTITAQGIKGSKVLEKYINMGFVKGKETPIEIETKKPLSLVSIRLEKKRG